MTPRLCLSVIAFAFCTTVSLPGLVVTSLSKSWAPWCEALLEDINHTIHGDSDPCGCLRHCRIPYMQMRTTFCHHLNSANTSCNSDDAVSTPTSSRTRASSMDEWRERKRRANQEQVAGFEEGGAKRLANGAASAPLVYVYELPEGLNAVCEDTMSQWNWMVDIGLEEWPPRMLGDMANFAYAIEPIVHALLLHSNQRTLDPAAAHWFYIPFYAGCSLRESMYVEPVSPGVSEHDERLKTLYTWLSTAPLPSTYYGWKPHAVTVGHSCDSEALGLPLFERVLIFTFDVHVSAPTATTYEARGERDRGAREHRARGAREDGRHSSEREDGRYSSEREDGRYSSEPPSSDIEKRRAASNAGSVVDKERDEIRRFGFRGRCQHLSSYVEESFPWCPRASAPADVAIPYFPEPGLSVFSSGDEWLRTRRRRLDFFQMAAPHDISRQLLEEAFHDYHHRYAADAEVRVTTHMLKEEATLAAGAVQYRAHLLNSKFCLITKGHQWSARHLWNAVAGGCVPVLVGAYTTLDLPFQAGVQYANFSVRTPYSLVAQPDLLVTFLRDVLENDYERLRDGLSDARAWLLPGRGNPLLPRGGAGFEGSRRFTEVLMQEVSRRLPLWEHLLLPRVRGEFACSSL